MRIISWLSRIIVQTALLLAGVTSYAQHLEVETLIDSLEVTRESPRKVDILNSIAEKSIGYDLNKSIASAQEARELGQSLNYQNGIANANKWLGKGYSTKGKTPEALEFFMDALAVYRDMNDSIQMADIYKNLANVYSSNGNNREAMRYYDIAMDIYRNISDRAGESAILNNIGTIYLSLSKPDSALYYLEQSRLSNLEIRDNSALATNYTNMGFAYADKGDYTKAIEYYEMCYAIAVEIDEKETLSTSLLNIGDSFMYLGQFDAAEEKVKEGLIITEAEGYKYNTYIGYYTLGEINEKRGDYKESVEWYHKAEGIDEELRSAATINALMDVQSRQLEEAQIREIERINAVNEEKIQSGRFRSLLFLSLAILALVLLLGFTYYFMKRHKSMIKISLQHQEINKQKEQIETQSRKINQVNETLRLRNKRLRELNEDKSYMMSVVAHDLKSPLNQINGLANVIKLDQKNLTQTQVECLDNIDLASTRLRNLVDKILESRNLDRRPENLLIEEIDIEKMAKDVVNDFSTAADVKKISLETYTAKNGASVRADKHYLRQVFDNLLSNAIKFSPPGKKVIINIENQGEKVMTEVKDEGPGISQDDQRKLFQEYAVLSAKPTGGESSTGLGLAIVKNYVDKMGGEIWCESDLGQGTSFKVSLDRS